MSISGKQKTLFESWKSNRPTSSHEFAPGSNQAIFKKTQKTTSSASDDVIDLCDVDDDDLLNAAVAFEQTSNINLSTNQGNLLCLNCQVGLTITAQFVVLANQCLLAAGLSFCMM